MDKRQAKRYNREHRIKRTPTQQAQDTGHVIVMPPVARPVPVAGWDATHARAEWGDLRVVVMPKLDRSHIPAPSNTGIVVAAPLHPSLLGGVVVNNGRKPDCEEPVLNMVYTATPDTHWMTAGTGLHATCVPRHRDFPLDFDLEAVKGIMAQGLSRADAEAQADRILGWSPYGVTCSNCGLEIGDTGPTEVSAQARAFGWSMSVQLTISGLSGPKNRPLCPTCADAPFGTPGDILKPWPSEEEFRRMESEG